MNKLLKDTLGSLFNKYYEKGQKDDAIMNFTKDINNRVSRIIASFYRINGLLSICKDKKYIEYFSPHNIAWFLNQIKEYTLDFRVKSAYRTIERNIYKFENLVIIRNYLKENKDYELIGYGNEGFVIRKNNLYKKIYLKKLSEISKEIIYI